MKYSVSILSQAEVDIDEDYDTVVPLFNHFSIGYLYVIR